MQVRKYKADSLAEATNKVKKSIGPDALILTTKKIMGGGQNGKREQFEVWAVPGERQGETEPESLVHHETIDGLKSHLVHIQNALYLITREEQISENLAYNREALELYTKLVRTGIQKKYINEIFLRKNVFEKKDSKNNNGLHRYVLSEIMGKFKVAELFNDGSQKQKIAAFVGPTEAGCAYFVESKKEGRTGIDRQLSNRCYGAIEELCQDTGDTVFSCF